MEELLFNAEYINMQSTLQSTLLLAVLSVAAIYTIYFALTKFLFRKSKMRKELSLRLAFLWSIFVYIIFFNIYILVFLFKVGIVNLDFMSSLLYLGILPQMFTYLCLVVLFFIKKHSVKALISENSLN